MCFNDIEMAAIILNWTETVEFFAHDSWFCWLRNVIFHQRESNTIVKKFLFLSVCAGTDELDSKASWTNIEQNWTDRFPFDWYNWRYEMFQQGIGFHPLKIAFIPKL